MAKKMKEYLKYVFTRHDGGEPLTWANSERVVAPSDEDVVRFVAELKRQPGGDIHLAGGAALVQDFVRLGLVDRFRLLVYPVYSAGACWFDKVETPPHLQLEGLDRYANGVVAVDYRTVHGDT